jgi:hypothetical protein
MLWTTPKMRSPNNRVAGFTELTRFTAPFGIRVIPTSARTVKALYNLHFAGRADAAGSMQAFLGV